MSVKIVNAAPDQPPATHDQKVLALLTEIRDLLKARPAAASSAKPKGKRR